MIVREIKAKAILSKSRVYDYALNPYTGCQHGCSYCYARFMKRFTGHKEPWGEFVDVKINAADLLRSEVKRKKKGRVWVSGVCDPYQPLEAKGKLSQAAMDQRMSLITPQLTYDGFDQADIITEAVFENMALKNNLVLIPSPVRHIGTDRCRVLLKRMLRDIEARADIQFQTEAADSIAQPTIGTANIRT